MVSAGHYLAAHAGFTILEAGGNAVDAGCAAGMALGVVQSDIVNVAGVAPTIIHMAETEETVTIDGLGVWPKAASAEFFRREYGGSIPEGLLRTVTPAAPDAWITALELYGTMSFGEVASSSIRFAREGFAIDYLMAQIIKDSADDYRRWPSSAEIYLPGGRPPEPGERFVQADLAASLQYMADEETAAAARKGREGGLKAARDAFYRGDIAQAIAKYHRENGGWMTEEDLAEYRVRVEPPLKTIFGDIEVNTCGPWCQGPVLLQMLNLLGNVDLGALAHNSPAYIHRIAETVKLAFADRHHYYADPEFVDVPMDGLLSKEYARLRCSLVDPDRAAPGMPAAGDPYSPNAICEKPKLKLKPATGPSPAPSDTSYACVVDRHGNAFSTTPSDLSRESPIIPGTGLCPSTRGMQSWTDPNHPAVLAPGKRPRLTPNPAMAKRDRRVIMPFGTPGGDAQAQAMLQVFLNVVVFGMQIQEAIEEPRFISYSFPGSFEPHDYFPNRLNLEGRLAKETGETLAAMGHQVEWWPDWHRSAGAVCAIVVDDQSGMLHAGADARRSAYALGW